MPQVSVGAHQASVVGEKVIPPFLTAGRVDTELCFLFYIYLGFTAHVKE